MAHYINKIEFHKLLKTYRDINLDVEQLEDDVGRNHIDEIKKLQNISSGVYNKIGKQFLLIATNFTNKPRYINYSSDWKGDMISEAVYDMIRYIHNYDVDLMEDYIARGRTPDPFAYFSTYVRNGAMRYLSERYRDNDVIINVPFIENMDKRELSYD